MEMIDRKTICRLHLCRFWGETHMHNLRWLGFIKWILCRFWHEDWIWIFFYAIFGFWTKVCL